MEDSQREHKRVLRRCIRQMAQQENKLRIKERRLKAEIERQNQSDTTPGAQTAELAAIRTFIGKISRINKQLNVLLIRMDMVQSTQAITAALGGISQALSNTNRSLHSTETQKSLRNFEEQAALLGINEMALADALSLGADEMAENSTEEEGNRLLEELSAEARLSSTANISQPVSSSAGSPTPETSSSSLADLRARLDSLKGPLKSQRCEARPV